MKGILNFILLNPDEKSLEISHQSLMGNIICDGHVRRCIGYKIIPAEIHECCMNAEFWELKVEIGQEIQTWGPLLRSGGDAISLSLNTQDNLTRSNHDQILKSFEFKTTKVKIDNDAHIFISKYYPDLSFEEDMVVCLGIASWEYSL